MNRAAVRSALADYDRYVIEREALKERYDKAFDGLGDYASLDEEAADLNVDLVEVLDNLVSAIRAEGE